MTLAKLVIERLATSPAEKSKPVRPLRDAVKIGPEKVLGLGSPPHRVTASLVLVVLAAGKGTRFGHHPKCIQRVLGVPLARHSIDAFRTVSSSAPPQIIGCSDVRMLSEVRRVEGADDQMVGIDHPTIRPPDHPTSADHPTIRPSVQLAIRSDLPSVITVVGYKHDEVSTALGPENVYVLSENPTGGTAFAAFEAFSVPGLAEANPLLVITMGDRVVPASVFRRLLETHLGSPFSALRLRSSNLTPDDRGQTPDEKPTWSGVRHPASGVSEPPIEAALTFLTARYEPPKHQGRGRVLRNGAGRVVRIVEQKDIAAEADPLTHQALESLTEGNCPLYALRAASLFRLLGELDNANAQGQYYLTDIVAAISSEGGEIRTITTSPTDAEFDLLCSDVTRPQDLALLEGVLSRQADVSSGQEEIARAAAAILADRPPGQAASIARQLEELHQAAIRDKLGYQPDQPVAIGISGGRLRIAFMHPDMGRFFGPAWQMPIGAVDAKGDEQIVVLAQAADDRRLHLHPLDPKYRESVNFVSADEATMYPGLEIADWHSYEGFGTRMSETLLLSLGYFSDAEVEARRQQNLPLPPPSLRVSNSMRRPFALVGNAIASLRTLREGHLGAKVQVHLDREHFRGLRIACTGGIPQGGFSSSSALTVATKNALNSLFDLGIPADLLVHLACQAEYGTGVRAGSLDQATEQKGKAGQGTLISSNPADNYRILGTYKVPTERFRVIFPYTVERDRAAWRWSWGISAQRSEVRGQRSDGQRSDVGGQTSATPGPIAAPSSDLRPPTSDFRRPTSDLRLPKLYGYGETPVEGGPLTTGEVRKMTGKAAEIAAILTRLPLDTDFFKVIESDLLEDGQLNVENRRWICGILLQLPLLMFRGELQRRVADQRDWYISELVRVNGLDRDTAAQKTDATFASLFAGWREPVFRRAVAARGRKTEDGGQTKDVSAPPSVLSPPSSAVTGPSSVLIPSSSEQRLVTESGVPLRAMLAYLFSEVAKNFWLIHHPDEWIEYVTRSQQGDRCVDIDSSRLPDRVAMETELDWEKAVTGPDRLNLWLERFGAVPYNFNQGLDDASLGEPHKPRSGGTEDPRTGVSPSPPLSASEPPHLSPSAPPEFHRISGGNFFRGLALIDLADAMLKRAFGADAVAVRVNAAGQGDYFQVHVDTTCADVADVKQFLRRAFYRRFGLSPEPDFVETNPGAGALGVDVSRFDLLPQLVRALRA